MDLEQYPALKLMRDTSKQFYVDVQDSYESVAHEFKNARLGIYVFGSARRKEMLPHSDCDIVILQHDKDDDQAVNKLKEKIESLPYDKIDFPDTLSHVSDILNISGNGSPDTNTADCVAIAGDASILAATKGGCYEKFLEPTSLRRKLVFQHHFFDYWSRQKLTKDGVNIKYSIGGARDLILLDQWHDWQTGGEGTVEALENGVPQIISSAKFLESRYKYNGSELLKAVEIINKVKHGALEEPVVDYGNVGILNTETAALHLVIDQAYFHERGIASPEMLICAFNGARQAVFEARNYTINLVRGSYGVGRNDVEDELLDEYWIDQQYGREDPSKKRRLLESGDWFGVASVACSSNLQEAEALSLLETYLPIPGFEYLARIITRHKVFTPAIGRLILQSDRLAADSAVSDRYKSMITETINAQHASTPAKK